MKPSIYNISAFDARYDKTIEFIYQGNQAFSNILTIRNNSTNTIVYQQEFTTMQLKHTITANSLANGILYSAVISVKDKDGISSANSNPILFYCYTTPTFGFTNIIENQVIQNSSYLTTLEYSQIEGEELQSFQVMLYNANKTQIWTSGVKYDTSNFNITISNLEDNGFYYVKATGITINGMNLDSGFIPIYVDYIVPSVYAIVSLENQVETGSVLVKSNIVSLEGSYSESGVEPTYIDDDYIDLLNTNARALFNQGFSLDKNFTFNMKGYNFSDFSTILQLSNGEKTINLYKKKGSYLSQGGIEKVYFELRVPSGISYYVIQSNYINIPNETDILSIWVRRIDNVYGLFVENLSII